MLIILFSAITKIFRPIPMPACAHLHACANACMRTHTYTNDLPERILQIGRVAICNVTNLATCRSQFAVLCTTQLTGWMILLKVGTICGLLAAFSSRRKHTTQYCSATVILFQQVWIYLIIFTSLFLIFIISFIFTSVDTVLINIYIPILFI